MGFKQIVTDGSMIVPDRKYHRRTDVWPLCKFLFAIVTSLIKRDTEAERDEVLSI
jgi:hypothetical protein